MIRKIITGAFFGFLALTISSTLYAQSDVIKERQALMKSNSADAKAIKAAVDAKDYATIETKAKDIMGNAEKIPSLFPKGSTVGKTKAKPEIWEKPDQFAAMPKKLGKAASELAAAAKAGNEADVNVKVKALGAVCNSCHKEFRAAKYAE
ncbi:MAG: c-type cytochrome [Chloroflexota bacterium]|jgi:cytochrome c556